MKRKLSKILKEWAKGNVHKYTTLTWRAKGYPLDLEDLTTWEIVDIKKVGEYMVEAVVMLDGVQFKMNLIKEIRAYKTHRFGRWLFNPISIRRYG